MSRVDEYRKLFSAMSKKQAKIGWFPSAQYPVEDGGNYVAGVALTHEFGSPAQHIPPRPFLRPTIANNKGDWIRTIKGLARQKRTTDEDVLEGVGLQMVGDFKDMIGHINNPKLAASTIAKRKERGNNSVKPLNDTGYMIATLTNTVESK